MATLTFGKYNGKTLEQIAAIDPGYLSWMAGESINRNGVNFSRLAAQVLKSVKPAANTEIVIHGRECIFCCNPINGTAIPVRETSQGRTYTKYAHRICAERAAEED